MDKIALSLQMKRLTGWLDDHCEPAGFIRKQFDRSPFGNCYVTIDPERQGLQASHNKNRVYLCGAEPGLEQDGLARLIELFSNAGVRRFFVWLSPGPNMEVVRDWLGQLGFSRRPWVSYPTLCREIRSLVPVNTDLAVREVSPQEVAAARARLGDTMWPQYAISAGKQNFFHYIAFDGDRPVAVASLGVFDNIGYLMNASTAESDRKRGAQQALIAKRIERAEEAGCSVLVSETLSILEHSLRNLQRAGFHQIFEREVYVWNGEPDDGLRS
jgi:hypothetical protein